MTDYHDDDKGSTGRASGIYGVEVGSLGIDASVTGPGIPYQPSLGAAFIVQSSPTIVTPEQFGAAGDGVTFDDAAFTAAIAALPSYTATHPDYRAVTLGGGVLRLSNKKYRLRGLPAYKSSMAVIGGGLSSQLLIEPTSAHNGWQPSANWAALNGHHNVLFSNFAMFGQNANAKRAFSITRSRGVVLDSLWIRDFAEYNVYFGWASGTYSFYNHIANCSLANSPVNLYLDSLANAIALANVTIANDSGYASGDYNIVMKGTGLSINGLWSEGRVNLAHIHDQSVGGGISYNGVYAENSTGLVTPFLLKDMTYGTASPMAGVNLAGVAWQSYAPLLKFENFNQTSGEASAVIYRLPDNFGGGVAEPIDLFVDSDGGHGFSGLDGWTVSASHSRYLIDTKTRFNGAASRALVHNGDSANTTMYITLATLLAKWANQRIFITIDVYDPDNSISTINVSNPTRTINYLVDYGNGWKRGVIDFAVTAARLSACQLNLTQFAATPKTAYIMHLRAYLHDWPRIGSAREGETLYGTAAPLAGTWTLGDRVVNSAPTAGGTAEWRCTASGTFSTASTTGDTVNTSPIIINCASTLNFGIGDYVTVTAGFTGTRRIIDKTATTLTLDANAASSNVGVTIATPDPTFTVLTLS